MNHPKPDKEYQALQAELREARTKPGHSVRLEKELEKRFVSAWGFKRDRLQLSYKLEARLRTSNGGLDHRNYFTGPDDARVIVTQPYGDFADQLRADFTLDDGTAPEVIEASEWGFHSPGKASLVVLVFPSDYAKSLDKCRHERRKRETAARRQHVREQVAVLP